MSAQSTRIWENDTLPPAANNSKPAQLPSIATLTNEIPHGGNNSPTSAGYPTNRSSDQWNTPPQSTRSSAYSSGHNGFYYSSSTSISSPHRASNSSQPGATSHPVEYHTAQGPGSQASPGFVPPQHSLGLPTINQQYQDQSQYRGSHEFPPQESRRSSLGSQVNTGFNNLHINNGVGSPYNNHSGNPSQSSIAVSLQRDRDMQRGIPPANGIRNSGTSSLHQHPMSPLSPYPGESKSAFSSRTAPVIAANPMKEVYHAEKPTAGQPYAFPDPEMSDVNRSSGSLEPNGSKLSRRNSDHTSITSSIITNDSKLPPGQHRLDDDPMPGTHHHSLQHKQVSNLASEADSPEANSPYSRTPALRNSHKIAERKRRTEMKQLFDQLRAQIPASHGSKSSKWEILSKASDHIRNMETLVRNLESSVKVGRDAQIQLQQTAHELEAVRRENENLRNENHHIFQEVQHYRDQARPNTATAMHSQPSVYAPPPAPSLVDPSRSLPPLTNGIPAANSMQGIQYSDERR